MNVYFLNFFIYVFEYFRDDKDTIIFLIVVMAFLLLTWRTQKSYSPRRERSVEWNYQLIVW